MLRLPRVDRVERSRLVAIRNCRSSLFVSRVYPRSNRQEAATGSPCFVVRSLVWSGLVFASLSRGSRLRDSKVGPAKRNPASNRGAAGGAILVSRRALTTYLAVTFFSRAHFVPPPRSVLHHVPFAPRPFSHFVSFAERPRRSHPIVPDRILERREARISAPFGLVLSMSFRVPSRSSPTLSPRATESPRMIRRS